MINLLHRSISIHALREEGDTEKTRTLTTYYNFYPRPPRGGRLSGNAAVFMYQDISIHALREEGDLNFWRPATFRDYFYPRPPRGGRHRTFDRFQVTPEFLSTPSARRATHSVDGAERHRDISIHALREEGDRLGTAALRSPSPFLSTPSARRATRRKAGSQT